MTRLVSAAAFVLLMAGAAQAQPLGLRVDPLWEDQGRTFVLSGAAINFDFVHVWGFPETGPVFLGGVLTDKIDRALQRPAGGFELLVTNAPVGTYPIVVYAHSPTTNTFPLQWGQSFTVHATNARISFIGDSIVDQELPTWPDFLSAAVPVIAQSAHVVNYGISGARASAMVTNYPTGAHVNRPPTSTDVGWCFVHGGGNDISDGVTPAVVYGYLKSLWASSRADGYHVMALTVLPRTAWGSASAGAVTALNNLILSDPSLYDDVVRVDLVLTNPADTTMFYDGTHPTMAGAQLVAQAVAAKIQ